MASIRVPYLVQKRGRAGALPRWFWQPATRLRRAGWEPQRVPADWASYGDPAALEAAAIAAAQALNAGLATARIAAAPAPAVAMAHSVKALIADYVASDAYRDLRPSTRRGYRQCLDRIEAWASDTHVAAIDWQRIETLKRSMRRTPSFRNAVLRVLRLLLARAVKLHWIARNPAERPGLQGIDPTGLVWPREAVAAIVAAADAMGRHSVGTAVMLDEWLGQREGDILRLPRSIYRAGNLAIRQSKTGVGVSLPIDLVPALQQRLEAELARIDARFKTAAVKPVQLILDEVTGTAYTADRFRHVFAAVRAQAAEYLLPGRPMDDPAAFTVRMTDLWFMHLRHTAVTRLEEAGCELGLIAAVTGHTQKSILAIVERYGRRTRKMARLAFEKRLAAETPASSRTEEAQG
jgi:integrase